MELGPTGPHKIGGKTVISTFDLLEDGDKFRTVGIVTGKLGLYVYTKRRAEIGTGTEGQLPNGNAVAFEGTHKEKWEFFSGHQRVEKV